MPLEMMLHGPVEYMIPWNSVCKWMGYILLLKFKYYVILSDLFHKLTHFLQSFDLLKLLMFFQVYIIDVMVGEHRWTVKHRYSDFHDLHEKVKYINSSIITTQYFWYTNNVYLRFLRLSPAWNCGYFLNEAYYHFVLRVD